MKAAGKTPTTSAAAEKQLEEFISKFDQKNQALIRAIRKAGSRPRAAAHLRMRNDQAAISACFIRLRPW